MNNLSSLEISDIQDEYPEVTQADLDHAVFRVDLKPSPRKQSITIDLDENLIAYFKLKAGEDGYQSLISEVLRKAISQEELQSCLPSRSPFSIPIFDSDHLE